MGVWRMGDGGRGWGDGGRGDGDLVAVGYRSGTPETRGWVSSFIQVHGTREG